MFSVKAFMEALSFECFTYTPDTDTQYWPMIGPNRAPVVNEWDQFGWMDENNNNNNNNNADQPPEGDPPTPPTDESKSEEVKKLLASTVILHEGDLDYGTANKLLSASILCTAISSRNYHHFTTIFTTLNTLVRRNYLIRTCFLLIC